MTTNKIKIRFEKQSSQHVNQCSGLFFFLITFEEIKNCKSERKISEQRERVRGDFKKSHKHENYTEKRVIFASFDTDSCRLTA